MFSVRHAIFGGNEDQSKQIAQKLLSEEQFRSISAFQPWHQETLKLLAWKPRFPCPSVCVENVHTRNYDNYTHKNLLDFAPEYERNISSRDRPAAPYISKQIIQNDIDHTMVQWSSASCREKNNGKKVCANDTQQPRLSKIEEQCKHLNVSMKARGKWLILESGLKDGLKIKDLWICLTDDLSNTAISCCNITLQTKPCRILIYTDVVCCLNVLDHFPCLQRQVQKMSYIVHPKGELFQYNHGCFYP